MARAFGGGTDNIICATGGLSGFTYGTIALIFRLTNFADWANLLSLQNSGGTYLGSTAISQTGGVPRWYTGGVSDATTAIPAGVWICYVVRKATGNVAARFSWMRYDTGAWVHENGGGSSPNASAPGSSGNISFLPNIGGPGYITGDIAARAAWSNSLPWTADTTGDAVLESSGLPFALTAWYRSAPDALWLFDQADVAQTIPDLSGGGAQQSSITGTTVSTNSVPGLAYGSFLF